METKAGTNRAHLLCETDGCGRQAGWWVKTPAGVWKTRCSACRDELISVFNHEYMEPIDRPAS